MKHMKMPLLISVVICTHNRANLLCDAVQSILQQDYAHEQYELIVVDNASRDQTQQAVEQLSQQYPDIRYVYEPRVGLSHARNRGWQEATGRYVGYLDDDAKASPGWLRAANQIIDRVAPHLFGGPYYAFYDFPRPDWLPETFGSKTLGTQAKRLADDESISGGNMFVRRDVLAEIGGFDSAFGMVGQKIAYAEEIFLQKKIRDVIPGAVIYYDPDLFIYHLVRAEKTRLTRMMKARFSSAYYGYLARNRGSVPSSMTIAKHTLKLVLSLIKYSLGLIFRNRKKYPWHQRYVVEKIIPLIAQGGKLLGMVQTSFKK